MIELSRAWKHLYLNASCYLFLSPHWRKSIARGFGDSKSSTAKSVRESWSSSSSSRYACKYRATTRIYIVSVRVCVCATGAAKRRNRWPIKPLHVRLSATNECISDWLMAAKVNRHRRATLHVCVGVFAHTDLSLSRIKTHRILRLQVSFFSFFFFYLAVDTRSSSLFVFFLLRRWIYLRFTRFGYIDLLNRQNILSYVSIKFRLSTFIFIFLGFGS